MSYVSQCKADAEHHWPVLDGEWVLSQPRTCCRKLGISPIHKWMARTAFNSQCQHSLVNHHHCHPWWQMLMIHLQIFPFACLNAVTCCQAQAALGPWANLTSSWWMPELWACCWTSIQGEFMVKMSDEKGIYCVSSNFKPRLSQVAAPLSPLCVTVSCVSQSCMLALLGPMSWGTLSSF